MNRTITITYNSLIFTVTLRNGIITSITKRIENSGVECETYFNNLPNEVKRQLEEYLNQ